MKILIKSLEYVYSNIIIYAPSVAIAYLGIHLFYAFWAHPVDEELNKQILNAVKMATTLAALSFYAGYMTPHETKKPIFYLNGERFFHVAIMMFSINILQKLLLTQVNVYSNEGLLHILKITVSTIASFFMCYAILLLSVGVTSLLKVLHLEVKQRVHAGKS